MVLLKKIKIFNCGDGMKRLLIVLSLVSMSANAAYSIKNAEVNYSAARSHFNDVAYHQGSGTAYSSEGLAAIKALNEAGTLRAQAYADARSAEMQSQYASNKLAIQTGQPTINVNVKGVQVAVPFNSFFTPKIVRGGHNDHYGNSSHEHGTGNGGNNAANSNSAHGLGGGNHIGGGSAQSGSRGHW